MTSSRIALAAVLLLATGGHSAMAIETPASWIADGGLYSAAANWDVPIVPCNTGPTTFVVTIPESSDDVMVDAATPSPCEIDNLTLGTDAVLRLKEGSDLRVRLAATLDGLVSGEGGDYESTTAGVATLLGSRARFQAGSGSILRVDAEEYSPIGLTRDVSGRVTTRWDILHATDADTLIDLGGVRTLDASFPRDGDDVNGHLITAEGGGSVDLSGLETTIAPEFRLDWIQFSVSGATSALQLDSLAEMRSADRGQTYFELTDSARVELPSLASVEAFTADLSGASQLVVGGPMETFSTVLLTKNVSGRVTNRWDILQAMGADTLIDLGNVRTLDASFPRDGDDVNRHLITAKGGATLDLSGLETTIAPEFRLDWIQFSVSGATSALRLDSLAEMRSADRGQTYFELTDSARVELPSLASVEAFTADLSGGSQLVVGGPMETFSTVLLTKNVTGRVTNRWDILHATNADTLIDLGGVRTLDAGFPPDGDDRNLHEVSADTGASLDLSGTRTLVAPSGASDWIRFSAGDGSLVDLSSLEEIRHRDEDGRGSVRFETTGSGRILLDSLRTLGTPVALDLAGSGSFQLQTALFDSDDSVLLQGPATTLSIAGDLEIDLTPFQAQAGSTVEIGGSFDLTGADESAIVFREATVHMNGDGSAVQSLEVAGFDIGAIEPVEGNFEFGRLVVGEDGAPTIVGLVDRKNNGNRPGSCDAYEALYLLGADGQDGLELRGGSVLFVNEINVYARVGDEIRRLNDMFGINEDEVPFGDGFLARDRGDLDADGVVNPIDNCPRVPNGPDAGLENQDDVNCNRVGNVCECGDATLDGLIDARDARRIQQCSIGTLDTAECEPLCDNNLDGECDSRDARRDIRISVGDPTIDFDDMLCALRPEPFIVAPPED